jgi:hypothetical protein
MRKYLICTLLVPLLFACGGDDRKISITGKVKSVAQDGLWKVTYFLDASSDSTIDFSAYMFDFASDNTVKAARDSSAYAGTWSATDDDDADDGDDLEDVNFNIYFNAPDFQVLNGDWEIVSLKESKIELRDLNGGNGATDFLTFEKFQ